MTPETSSPIVPEEMQKWIADALFNASQELLRLYVDLADKDVRGAHWIELMALLYECAADVVETGGRGTGPELTLTQAKIVADAHLVVLRAWLTAESLIGVHKLERYSRLFHATLTIIPTVDEIRPLIPAWAWQENLPLKGK